MNKFSAVSTQLIEQTPEGVQMTHARAGTTLKLPAPGLAKAERCT
jgi:hypothetical protein